MFLKSKRLQKVIAALSITGLLSLGASSVHADVTFEQTLDLSSISGAAFDHETVTATDVCLYFTGLGDTKSIDISGLTLTAYMDTNVVKTGTYGVQNIYSGSDGAGIYCISNGQSGLATEFSDFTGYTKITVDGSLATADVNFTQNVDLSAVQTASFSSFTGGSEFICLYYQGLGTSRSVDFKNLVLKGFTGDTESVSVNVGRIRVDTDADGKGNFCFESAAGRNAAAFNGFNTYDSVTLSGDLYVPVVPSVHMTYSYAQGITATPSARGDVAADNLCIYVTNLPARAELSFSNVSVLVNDGLDGQALVALPNQSNFAADSWGNGQACWYSYEGSELYPLGDLSLLSSFYIDADLAIGAALQVGSVDVTATLDTELFPDLSLTEASHYIDPHVICFNFTGGPSSQETRLGEITITLTKGSVVTTADVEKSTMAWFNDQGELTYCLESVVADPASYGNLTTYDTIDFSAKLTVASVWSDVLSRYLLTKGITLVGQDFNYDSDTNRTNVSLTIRNDGEERLAYNVLGFQWESKDLIGYDKFWLLPPGQDTYVSLGYLVGDQTQGDPSVDVWTFLKTATPSELNLSRLRLPAGIRVVGDAFDWRYSGEDAFSAFWSNKTFLSLILENTTDEPITIKAPLTWKVGNTTLRSTGFEVGTIEPNGRAYIQGSTDLLIAGTGDIRQGAKVSVSGTITKVNPNVVDDSDFVVPQGVEISGWNFNYAAADRRTEVYATMLVPCDGESAEPLQDLVAANVYFNGSNKSTGISPIANGWCNGDSAYYQVLVGYLGGDQRSGRNIKVAAEWTWSTANPFPNSREITTTTYNNGATCYITSPTEWLFEPSATGGRTIVQMVCYNWGNSTAKFDLSKVTGSYINDSDVPVNFSPLAGVNKVKLKVGEYKLYKVLATPGEVRTGGIESTFGGKITITKG